MICAPSVGVRSPGAPLPDARLDALATLTRSIVETRGWPDGAATEAFFKASFGTSEYLEVVVGVTVKTLSNYVNHAANTPLDAAFQTAKWAA
jgi:alkylhydroperoxidase family enzyme